MSIETANWKYVGGRVAHLDCADIDRMSIVYLHNILRVQLGFLDGPVYLLKDPESRGTQLVFIEDDETLLDVMAKTLRTQWTVDVYCIIPLMFHTLCMGIRITICRSSCLKKVTLSMM